MKLGPSYINPKPIEIIFQNVSYAAFYCHGTDNWFIAYISIHNREEHETVGIRAKDWLLSIVAAQSAWYHFVLAHVVHGRKFI
jgi:hypothetical protein